MWQKIHEIMKLIFNFAEELQRNRSDIEQLQQEVRELTLAVQRVVYELQRIQQNEAHEREKLALRLEIELLRAGRELPAQSENKSEE